MPDPTEDADAEPDPTVLFHIALEPEWRDAQSAGVYARSTRGLGLDDVGFIHCSHRHQVVPTAERFYADETAALVVLVIDAAALDDATAVVEEEVPSGERFPHVFGPIPVAAVTATIPLERALDGTFTVTWPSRPPLT